MYPNDPNYQKELEMIVNYFKQKGKKIQIQQEPIVGIIFKKNNNNIIYSYLASHLKFYYSPKDINRNMTIPNVERKSFIENAIKKSNIAYLNIQPYQKQFYRFYPVKFIGFKKVDYITNLLVKTNEDIITIYPKRIPTILKKEKNIIKTIILIDGTINTSKTTYIKNLFKGLKSIYEKTNVEFKLINKKDYSIEEFNSQNIVNKVLQYKNDNDLIPPLVITIGSEKNLDYYEDMKRKLFKYGFITQNIIYEHLITSKNYEINNLLLQILVKYGMKYY